MCAAPLLLALSFFPAAIGDWTTRYQTGEALLSKGKAEEAIRELSSALSDGGSGNAAVHDALGRAEHQTGRYDLARQHFQRAVRLSAANPSLQVTALANLARTHLSMDEPAAAGEVVQQALRLDPESPRLLYLLGQVQIQRKQFRTAIDTLNRALAGSGCGSPETSASILSDLALAYQQNKETRPNATGLIEQSLSRLPAGQARARVLANLGILHYRQGARKIAAEWLGRALSEMEAAVGHQHPDLCRILDDYAAVLEKIGRKVEARGLAQRAGSLRAAFGFSQASVDWREIRR